MRYHTPYSLPIRFPAGPRTAPRLALSLLWLILFTLLTSHFQLHAQWNPNGPVGAGKVLSHRDGFQITLAVSDGKGGAYLIWSDYSFGQVCGQYLDSMGVEKWSHGGIILNDTLDTVWEPPKPFNAWIPNVISDGAGGIIAAWPLRQKDDSSSHAVMQVKRYGPGGEIWSTRIWNFYVLSYAVLATDGNGGAYIGESRSGTNRYMQRISGTGQLLWPAPGALLGSGSSYPMQLAPDGRGGVYVAHLGDQNIPLLYRVDPLGNHLWGATGKRIPNINREPYIFSDSASGVFLFGSRAGGSVLHRLRPDGSFAWDSSGINIFSNAPRYIATQYATPTANGQTILGGSETLPLTTSDYFILTQKIDTSGTPQWNSGNPVLVVDTGKGLYRDEFQAVVSDGLGGAFFVIVSRTPNATINDPANPDTIRIQKISRDGQRLWGPRGMQVCIDSFYRDMDPDIVHPTDEAAPAISDGRGGMILSWIDARSDYNSVKNGFVYVTRLNPNGTAYPVELMLFTATLFAENVMLYWQTASETNNYGFEIERSYDGVTWAKLGFVPGYGTTPQLREYDYLDPILPEMRQPVLHYRLRQIDYDGTIEYSQERAVNVGSNPETPTLLPVYPNPAGVAISARFMLPNEMHVSTRIVNALGQVLYVTEKLYDTGWNSFDIPVAHFPSGAYYLEIQTGSGIQTEMFVKR